VEYLRIFKNNLGWNILEYPKIALSSIRVKAHYRGGEGNLGNFMTCVKYIPTKYATFNFGFHKVDVI
jgi:hypothetical protein